MEGSEREERRRAGGRSEKKFLQKEKKKKKKFALLAGGPGSRPGGLGRREGWGPGWGGGVALKLRCSGPVAPLPAAPPQPSFQPWTAHPEHCAPTEVRGGAGGETTWERWGRGPRRCSDAQDSPHPTRRPGAQQRQ